MRKIAIISDIHANIINFKKVLKDLENRKIYETIFLGDYIFDGFANNEVLNIIKEQNSLAVVIGNKEEFLDEDFDINKYQTEQFRNVAYAYKHLSIENLYYVRNLPKYRLIEVEDVKIMCCHGTPDYTRETFKEDKFEKFDSLINNYDFNVYLYGHTHKGEVIEYKDRYFINPSSLGMPLDGIGAKYGILTIDGNNIEYEQIVLEQNYEELEEHYKNSEYYKEVGSWAQLVLMNLKYGYDYTGEFVTKMRRLANMEQENFNNSTPDALWKKEFEKFIKEKEIDKYI